MNSVKLFLYVKTVELHGKTPITDSLVAPAPEVPKAILERGETQTILFNFASFGGDLPGSADVAVIADYKAFGVPLHRFRSMFRFTGLYGENRKWQWQPQPSYDVSDEINKRIDEFYANHSN